MRISLQQFSFITILVLVLLTSSNYISGQCLEDQKSLLIKFKNNLTFDSSVSIKLVMWDENGTECCRWPGVSCDEEGHVLVLELHDEGISGGIDNSSSLFDLRYLEKLNLAYNDLNSVPIPTEIYKLANLTYLNFSGAGFDGQIPMELSRLTKLVILDLSNYNSNENIKIPVGSFSHPYLKLGNLDLKTLVRDLANLTELFLDGVNISLKGSEWCTALSSSLPQLRVLSMTYSALSGPLDPVLLNLRVLSVLRLDWNLFSMSPIPEFLANFTNLTTLGLAGCKFRGVFPSKIFQVPTLQKLDLSHNVNLTGTLPEFPYKSALRDLRLHRTSFTGSLPNSIANLPSLTWLSLWGCNFSGHIPSTMENLTYLVHLDLSYNNFTGPIPLFYKAMNLNHIDLSHNNLTGPLSSAHFGGLSHLEYINLEENSIEGTLPAVILSLPSLKELLLLNNYFSGEVDEFPNASSSVLETLDLSNNHLNGSIPWSIFKLKQLSRLFLFSNSLGETINIEVIKGLPRLTILDLSYNKLRIDIHDSNSTSFPFPQLERLILVSCKLKKLPDLKNQSMMSYLDLSDNNIEGEIPGWIWSVGFISYLNLSCNLLESLEEPNNISTHSLRIVDLHSNRIKGDVPLLPTSLNSLSLANNKFTGSIPSSICNLDELLFLDMSNNSIKNEIPSCLWQMVDYLGVVRLGRNNLSGIIPDIFPLNCSLNILDLGSNALEGKFPRSLERCASLEVLDIGNNKIRDTFPCILKKLTSLRVLILRSNRFHGNLQCPIANQTWPRLQIIDISSNNFGGVLAP